MSFRGVSAASKPGIWKFGIPGLRESAQHGLTGLNNSARLSIARDFRSGNPDDTSDDFAHGFVRDPLPLRIVGEIARHFHCPTSVLRFGRDWPEGFDLGDEFPATMFDEAGRYIGPGFNECCQPADWATDLIEVPRENGRGTRLVAECRQNFVEQNFIVTDTQQVFGKDRPARARTSLRARTTRPRCRPGTYPRRICR